MTTMLLLATLMSATQPLPRAAPPPPPATVGEEEQVLSVAQRLFDAIAARDAGAFATLTNPDAQVVVVDERGGQGVRLVRRTWGESAAAVAKGPAEMKEMWVGRPAVEVDGDMAMVWGRYRFTIAGKLSHCGVNHLSLLRSGGTWRISASHYSARTTGCD